MEAYKFIRKTFNLSDKKSINELPDLPMSDVVKLLNDYKEMLCTKKLKMNTKL